MTLQKLAERQCLPQRQTTYYCSKRHAPMCQGCNTSLLYLAHHGTAQYLCCFQDQYCHNRTVTPSINSLLASYPCGPFGGESGDRVSSGVSPSVHLYPPILALFSLPGMWMPGCWVLKCFTSLPLLGNLPSWCLGRLT